MCDEWKGSFTGFSAWAIANGYSDDLTIERIDVHGKYSPSNCKWIPHSDQAKNRRNTRYLIVRGIKMNLNETSVEMGLKRGTVAERIRRGWSDEESLSPAVKRSKNITYDGVTMSMSAWSRSIGLHRNAVAERIKRGWSIERALGFSK